MPGCLFLPLGEAMKMTPEALLDILRKMTAAVERGESVTGLLNYGSNRDKTEYDVIAKWDDSYGVHKVYDA